MSALVITDFHVAFQTFGSHRTGANVPNDVSATVDRHGTRLVDIQGEIGASVTDAPPLMGQVTANVWGTVGLSMPKLLVFKSNEELLEARQADVTVTITGSESDPIEELEIGSPIAAYWYRTNFGGGESFPAVPVFPVSPTFLLRNWALRYT